MPAPEALMVQRMLQVLAVIGGICVLVLLVLGADVATEELSRVFVVNFPEVQKIEGSVAVTGPVRLSQLVKFEDVVVPPVARTETTRLVEAGTLETDGFANVVLSLHGVVKGHVAREGAVGALLIPDETTIQEAFDEQGMMHFFLETAAGVTHRTPYFASTQPRFTVGFAKYRVLMYNSTDKTVSASLFAYLTN